jgi:mRNA interferase MazF
LGQTDGQGNLVKKSGYVPAQGDLVWFDFDPQAGHEQGGRRPAIVLSPKAYNQLIGLALVCPVTSREKGYPFEVKLSAGLPVSGVALADHVKNQDWRARRAEFIGRLDAATLTAVLQRTRSLLEQDNR